MFIRDVFVALFHQSYLSVLIRYDFIAPGCSDPSYFSVIIKDVFVFIIFHTFAN